MRTVRQVMIACAWVAAVAVPSGAMAAEPGHVSSPLSASMLAAQRLVEAQTPNSARPRVGRLPTLRHGTLSASPSPANLPASRLRLPASSFSAAGLSYDYDENASSADQGWFRTNHWWSYSRMQLVSAHFERADAQDGSGNPIYFRWQGSIFPSNALAYAAFNDGVSRTSHYDAGTSCSDIFHVPCRDFIYGVNDTDKESFELLQVNQCLGEATATAAWDVFDADFNAVNRIQSAVQVDGVAALKAACKGASGPAAPALTAPSAARRQDKGPTWLTGNDCYSFRGALWGLNEQTARLQSSWWTDLQADYDNNYPPPTGGSVPGVTQSQFQSAKQDMNTIHLEVDKSSQQTGVEWDVTRVGIKYGLNPKVTYGAFNWAIFQVFGAAYNLDVAAQDEYNMTGSGLSDYHSAQAQLGYAWGALKQLPCRPAPVVARATTAPPTSRPPGKTYTDPRYNFSFLCPSSWKVPSAGGTRSSGPTYIVNIKPPAPTVFMQVEVSDRVLPLPVVTNGEIVKDPSGPDKFQYFHTTVSGRLGSVCYAFPTALPTRSRPS